MPEEYRRNYDYSKTLWMKMFLARPDFEHGRSEVLITFEQALDIIKTVDALTQGITKIIYLVGWQGLGHDDCYPVMEEVNPFLKRECDETPRDSFLWLYGEAKKYNTVISIHGNISDAVVQTPIFDELRAANALANDINGEPAVLQILNGLDCYKTSYPQLWESGIFKRIFDRLCEVLPIREAGTIHLDNFCIAESLNPATYLDEQDEARNKMLDYINSLGIDVTSEYTYREAHFRNESPSHPNREMYAQAGEDMSEVDWRDIPIRTLGRIPATWWTSCVSARECIEIPPSLYSGHLVDKALLAVFYGAMHGEDIWLSRGNCPADWEDEFIYQFCTLQLPYFYLNRLKRLDIEENDGDYTAYFSENTVSCGKGKRIVKNGITIKDGDDVLLPLDDEKSIFIAYSKNGRSGEWNIPDADFTKADVYEIAAGGNKPAGTAEIKGGKIILDVKPGKALRINACFQKAEI